MPTLPDQDPIVTGLKRLYSSVVEEPVPSEFLDLLARIDAATAHGNEAAGDGDASAQAMPVTPAQGGRPQGDRP
jgi:hypothetical protein